MTAPTYNKRTKRRRQRQDYNQKDYWLKRTTTPPRWLVEDFGLDTLLAYRLRYPDAEFTFQRDLDTLLPKGVQHAHFAPFVIKQNKPVTIRTVYIDDRLTYWWHPNITTPYSIPVRSGQREVSLRTDGYVYTKTIYLESCRQLVLSFDAERWVTAGWTRREIKEPTKHEIDRIYERVFALSHMRTLGPVHFRARPGDIVQSTNQVSNAYWAPVGLAASNNLLRFWFPKGDSVGFRFEPRATYRITKERDRLYPLDKIIIENFQQRAASPGPGAPGLPQYVFQPPVQKVVPRYFKQAKRLPHLVPMEPLSRLQFHHLPKGLGRIVLAPVDASQYYYASQHSQNRVTPSLYDVLYHFRNDSVLHQRITLGEDSLTLLAYQPLAVRHINNFNPLSGYTFTRPPKASEVEYVDFVFSGNSVFGTVKESSGEVLPFATIYVKGSSTGTTTDLDGNFSLELPDGNFVLVVDYISFQPLEVAYGPDQPIVSPLTLTMKNGVALEEVVVIGYRVSLIEQDNTTPKGTETVSGELLMLTDKTTRLPDAFIRPERGPVTLRLPGNRLQQLFNDLNHIVDYPYACTEQTASRLIGLLQLRAVRKAEGKVFDQAGDMPKMIRRLEKLRRPDNGFGWWTSSEASTPWISLHVYRALAMAEGAGQPVADLTPVRRYLLGRVPELPARDQLQILLAMAEEGNPPTDAELTRIDTFSTPNDYELLAVTRLRQLRGDTVDVQRLIDSSSTHAALGRYWGERGFYFYRQPLDGRLACNLLAHRVLSAASREQEAAETINYLLGQSAARNRPGNVPLLGTNTLESARLLAELLPALLAEDDALAPPVVTLNTGGKSTRITTFPYETEVATSAVAGLRLQRAGSGPLPVSLYQRWFETEPTMKDDGFRLASQLTDARGRPLDQLKQGTTAYLEVTVTSTSDADYVLIEIPIPAGCSYADRNERRGPFAVHREYRRDRVAIFCDRLPAGTYTYKVALAPRFSGTYTLNPARAEMQYLGVVNGNGELKQVKIGE